MPRRNTVFPVRDYLDPRYRNGDIGKLINKVMQSGKKATALNTVYGALDMAADKLKKDQLEVFNQMLENITPIVEVKARRIGGANYQVPTEIKPRRRLSLAFRWLVDIARTRTGKPMTEKLALEMIDAYNNTGTVVKKKEETHKMADANKALAHFSKF
jgi:small subunit ribosomal protein S7